MTKKINSRIIIAMQPRNAWMCWHTVVIVIGNMSAFQAGALGSIPSDGLLPVV